MTLLTDRNQRIHDFRLKYPDAGPSAIGKEFGISRHAASRAIRAIDKSLNFKESDGVARIADEMGLKLDHVQGGWVKSKEGSFYVRPQDMDMVSSQETFLETIKNAFSEGYIPRAPDVVHATYQSHDPKLLTNYIIADFHLGMKAWSEECGVEYNLEVAERNLDESMDMMVSSTPYSESAVIVNLGDFFHANDSKNMTPSSGHILDVDGKFAEIAMVGIRAMRNVIYKALEKHAKVEYIGIPGNHDLDQSRWLTIALQEHFRNEPRVTFKYIGRNWRVIEHGINMIGFHHGHGIKFQSLALAMAAFEPSVWGRTRYRVANVGHIHHRREEEIGGVIVRSHRAITSADSYTNSHLYCSGQGMTSTTYHADKGEVQTNTVNFFNGRPV